MVVTGGRQQHYHLISVYFSRTPESYQLVKSKWQMEGDRKITHKRWFSIWKLCKTLLEEK